MNDVHVISSLDAIKALSDPVRLRIIQSLQRMGGASATQLKDEMDMPPSNITYHLKILEKNGLVHIAETRKRGNLIENIYEATARQFIIQKALVEGSEPEGEEDVVRLLHGISNMISKDINASRHVFISYEDYYLTADEAKALDTELQEKLKVFADRGPGPGRSRYGTGFLILHKPEEGSDE